MATEKAVISKVVKMRKSEGPGSHANGAQWSNERLEQWAVRKEDEPLFVYRLKQMLLTMIKEGKASPDGTDHEGNPTFTFR